MAAPDFEAWPVTITPMNAGNGPSGGGALLPGSVDQPAPQLGVCGLFAKPLKLAGAGPPVSVFSFDHCAPQKVTTFPTPLFPSPIAKAPPPGGKAKIRTVQLVDVVLPPTSATWTEIVYVPVAA